MRASLQVRISILFLLITSFSLTLVGWSNYRAAKMSILESLKDNSRAKVQTQAQDLSTWMSNRLAEVKVISHTDLIRFGSDKDRLEYLLRERDRSSGIFTSFGISDTSGNLRMIDGGMLQIADEATFNDVLKGNDVVSNPFIRSLDGKLIITMQVPIFDSEYRIKEVLNADLLTDKVFNGFTNYMVGPSDVTILFERDGTIIYHPDHSKILKSNVLNSDSPFQPIVPELVQNRHGFIETEVKGDPALIFYSEVPGTKWYMAVCVMMKSFEKSLQALFWRTVLTVIMTEIVLGIMMFYILNKVVTRIRQILNVTESVAGGNLKVSPILFRSKDEIGALAQSVNGMVDNLHNLFERLNAIINQNDYAIIVINTEFKVTYFNRTAEKILGYSADEMIFKETMFRWHDKQEIAERAKRLAQELGVQIKPDMAVFLTKSLRHEPKDYEWTYIHKNGTRFPVNLNVSPMRDQHGSVTGYVGIAHDIRLYKQTEETRNRLLSILDAAKDLIASIDTQGNIFYMNPAGMELLGITQLDDCAKEAKQYLDSGTFRFYIKGLHRVRDKGYWETEAHLVTTSGQKVPMSLIVVAHRDKSSKVVYYSVIARDISEHNRIWAEMLSAKEEADDANEAKSLFLARMSHEIRTPLNGIIGFAQLMLRTEMSAAQKEYSSKILASSHTLLRIVNDILDYSKVEAGKLELEKVSFNIHEIIRNISDMMSVLLGKEPIDIIIDTPEELPDALMGDPLRLEQVLLNLCSNAVKFTKQGIVIISLTISGTDSKGMSIEFSVADSGIGIPKEHLHKLFEPFSQADGSTSRKYGGTGLGLVISQNLIEMMGGSISVRSREGVGSCFTFTLYFERALNAKSEKLELPASRTVYRVLVVEDNPFIRNKLLELLSSLSLEVICAGSWAEGTSVLIAQDRHNPIHAVLLDMEAEDMYGPETWLEFKGMAESVDVRTIAMTTVYGREEMLGMQESERPDRILVKPLNRLGLSQAIRSVFEQLIPLNEEKHEVIQPPVVSSKQLRGRILLAEDNVINQQVAVELLRNEGFAVTIACDGKKALQYAEISDWDLLFMDIHMPEMDGYAATRQLRADRRFDDLPIIALTANAMPNERKLCFELGMNDILTKPIDVDELTRILDKWTSKERESLLRGSLKQANPEEMHQEGDREQLLPELPGIDLERVLQRLNGRMSILIHILNQFQLEYRHYSETLHGQLNAGQFDNVRRSIHSLKGVAGNLAADQLFELASSIEEKLTREGESFEWDHELAALERELASILEGLDYWNGGDSKPEM
ncbi:response regulator [Paenibacillus sp. UNC451MF]|uniref:response regulator n=1 Tax=Paenibacillus sp. UNC451MF TaxID=1449063 RepID=UPI00048C2637|nr:response regulator [Paenibacillus sp. UNC451MF]